MRRITRRVTQEQPGTLEELMSKVLVLIEAHPEWHEQEQAERMESIFRELLRL